MTPAQEKFHSNIMIRGVHYYLKAYSGRRHCPLIYCIRTKYSLIKKNLGERRGVGSCAGCFFRTATETGCFFRTATGTGCFFCFFGTATGTGCFFRTATGTGCFFRTATETGASPLLFSSSCFFICLSSSRLLVSSFASPLLLFTCFFNCLSFSRLLVSSIASPLLVFLFLHLPLLFFSSRVSSIASPLLVFLFLHLPLLFFSSRVSSIASPHLVFSNLSHGFCLACYNISVACDLCVGGEATSDGNDQLQG